MEICNSFPFCYSHRSAEKWPAMLQQQQYLITNKYYVFQWNVITPNNTCVRFDFLIKRIGCCVTV